MRHWTIAYILFIIGFGELLSVIVVNEYDQEKLRENGFVLNSVFANFK